VTIITEKTMNSYFLGLITLLLSINSQAQKLATKDVISFTLPKHSKSLTNVKRTANTVINKRSNIERRKDGTGELYEVDNVLIFVNAVIGETESNHLGIGRINDLLNTKLKWVKWTVGEIHTLNNYEYYTSTYEYPEDPKTYVLLHAVDKAHTKALSGSAEYLKTDKEKGEKVLNDFLKSMKFK